MGDDGLGDGVFFYLLPGRTVGGDAAFVFDGWDAKDVVEEMCAVVGTAPVEAGEADAFKDYSGEVSFEKVDFVVEIVDDFSEAPTIHKYSPQ